MILPDINLKQLVTMNIPILNILKYFGLDKNLSAILLGGALFSLSISWGIELLKNSLAT
jgi:hypothetical protein